MGTNAFGQPLRRKEDVRLLTGRGNFTADAIGPGDARAVMLRSPHAHARILRIDTEAARKMPGVLAVLTAADWDADGLGEVPSSSDLIRLPGTPEGTSVAFRPPHPVLARERVRFVGDNVAMVVAETEAMARDAAEAVSVDYDPLPPVTQTEAAMRPGAASVWDEAPDNVCFRWSAGDRAAVDAAFAVAAKTVRLTVVNNESMRMSGVFMLPRREGSRPNCRWRGRDTISRREAGACRRAPEFGSAVAGARPAWSIAFAGVWRSAC